MVPEFGNNHLGLSLDFVRIDWNKSRNGACVVFEFINPELWNLDTVDSLPVYWMDYAHYSELFPNDCEITEKEHVKKEKQKYSGQPYITKSYRYWNDQTKLNPRFKLLRGRKNAERLDVFNVDMHLLEPLDLKDDCSSCEVNSFENCTREDCKSWIKNQIRECSSPMRMEELANELSSRFYEKNARKFEALSGTLANAIKASINAQHCQDFVSKLTKFINETTELNLPNLWSFSDWQLQEYMNVLRDTRWKEGKKKTFPVFPSLYVPSETEAKSTHLHHAVFKDVSELARWIWNSRQNNHTLECQYYFAVLKYMLTRHELETETEILWDTRMLSCRMFEAVSSRIQTGSSCKCCSKIRESS
jgi:hypothetical protein